LRVDVLRKELTLLANLSIRSARRTGNVYFVIRLTNYLKAIKLKFYS